MNHYVVCAFGYHYANFFLLHYAHEASVYENAVGELGHKFRALLFYSQSLIFYLRFFHVAKISKFGTCVIDNLIISYAELNVRRFNDLATPS